MPTPVSNSSAYLSASEFLTRVDWRPIAQLMTDDDTTEDVRSALTDASSVEGARLAELLKDASGQVETAAFVGGRYAPADLAALSGNQAAYLKRLVADIAIGLCYQRRPDLFSGMPAQAQQANQILNALAGGDRIFGLQENIDASHMHMTTDTPENVETRNGMVYIARGFFGRRGNRYEAG